MKVYIAEFIGYGTSCVFANVELAKESFGSNVIFKDRNYHDISDIIIEVETQSGSKGTIKEKEVFDKPMGMNKEKT